MQLDRRIILLGRSLSSIINAKLIKCLLEPVVILNRSKTGQDRNIIVHSLFGRSLSEIKVQFPEPVGISLFQVSYTRLQVRKLAVLAIKPGLKIRQSLLCLIHRTRRSRNRLNRETIFLTGRCDSHEKYSALSLADNLKWLNITP